MAKNLVIVDSCVFIKAFRKDKKAIVDLNSISERTAYSIITLLELLTGANTKAKKENYFQNIRFLVQYPYKYRNI